VRELGLLKDVEHQRRLPFPAQLPADQGSLGWREICGRVSKGKVLGEAVGIGVVVG
jgi:hypothetical protein